MVIGGGISLWALIKYLEGYRLIFNHEVDAWGPISWFIVMGFYFFLIGLVGVVHHWNE